MKSVGRFLICALLCLLPAPAADVNQLTVGTPVHYAFNAVAPGFGTHVIDHSNDQTEFVGQSPYATPITRLGFRYASRAGSPPTYKISLQGVDGSGNPDAVIKGGGTPASATFTPPADDTWNGTWRWISLTTPYTPSRGEMLSVVIAYDSGTIDVSNCSTFTLRMYSVQTRQGLPYATENNAGVRTRWTDIPVFGVGTASSVWGMPIKSLYSTLISSNTAPDEQAFAFSLPAGSCSTFQVGGVRIGGANAAAGKTYLVTLYNGTTAIQQITVDSDQLATTGTRTAMRFMFDEATLSTLNCGTTYRIGFAPQETSANFTLYGFTADASGDLSAYPGGTAWYLSTRTDSGAWTDDPATRPFAEIILASLSAGSSGGIRSYAAIH